MLDDYAINMLMRTMEKELERLALYMEIEEPEPEPKPERDTPPINGEDDF